MVKRCIQQLKELPMSLLSYIVRRIGLNKGRPRVYLDCSSMTGAGFVPGQNYSRTVDAASKRVVLTVTSGGQYQVCKKEKAGRSMPVIDINSTDALSPFDGMEAVRIVFEAGRILIMPLASEMNRRSRLQRLRESLGKGELKTAGVSFGGGVLDHAAHAGLNAAGLHGRLSVANEIDEDLLNHASGHNDIWRTETVGLAAPMQEVVQDAALMSHLKPVDLLSMGIPCSGASRAGVSKRKLAIMEDHPEVGHLVASAIMIINRIQPAILVVENVPEYEASASAQILRQHMRDSGYEVQEKVLRARDFGCLENRNRWFMVCSTRGLNVNLDSLEPKVVPVRKLGDYLESIDPLAPDWRTFDYLKTKEVRDAAKGNSFAMQLVSPDSLSVPTLRKGYHKGGSTDPLLVHPTDQQMLRQLTVKEHARIKEVPEHLVEDLSKTDGHILLGQGIAYAPVRELFKRIGECLVAWATQVTDAAPSVQATYNLKLATG
jgi:DNA (cytosine-5)-methyltransferase 1